MAQQHQLNYLLRKQFLLLGYCQDSTALLQDEDPGLNQQLWALLLLGYCQDSTALLQDEDPGLNQQLWALLHLEHRQELYLPLPFYLGLQRENARLL